jgi:hypothetical protein
MSVLNSRTSHKKDLLLIKKTARNPAKNSKIITPQERYLKNVSEPVM